MAVFVPNNCVKQSVEAPASKSYAQRVLLAASLSSKLIEINNTGHCEDVLHIIDVVKQLGTAVQKSNKGFILTPQAKKLKTNLNCGESGLGIRLTTPIAASFGGEFFINGEGSLLLRPLSPFETFLPKMGVEVELNNGHLPLQIKGKLQGGDYTVDGSLSSQYISGLLMALPLCSKDSVLTVLSSKSTPYIDITLEVLQLFGVEVNNINYQEYKIKGNQSYASSAQSISVEGDWSGAAFWIVFGLINGEISIEQLNPNSTQADKEILTVVNQIGAQFEWRNNVLLIKKRNHQPFSFDATHCPDLFPILVVLAASIKGVSKIKGVHRLKHKESDRATVLIKEFGSLGLKIDIENDEMIIHGTGELKSGTVHSHNDHRIAMSGAIAASITPEGITIEGEDSVGKSYPEFWDVLLDL